ncbi:MAG TPA: alpha-ketoglutarate-dependent dioxygenase AlkB [Puia sp.]|jgi:alkylated DNA repair dioxygenase AlkB|nr:alpha-ketoglutarate-dependent dioxygenase AlkB [Puia sp.]
MEQINTRAVINLLPYDGFADYYGKILLDEQAEHYLDRLLNSVAWRNDEAVIFGRHIITKRKVAWYGDRSYSYAYSGKTRDALDWTPDLLELKAVVEGACGRSFNSCLLNLYHTGEEGMAWHGDDEKTLEPGGAIASLSLGAERKFSFRHRKTRETLSIQLETGSLLVMHGTTQTYWMHALPKTKKVVTPRVNLTFRTMVV